MSQIGSAGDPEVNECDLCKNRAGISLTSSSVYGACAGVGVWANVAGDSLSQNTGAWVTHSH
jgi:hypothetical protein